MSQEQITILVLDDDKDFLAFVELLLTEQGYKVLCCTDADSAMDMIGKHSPSVLLLDWRLGEQDSLELIRPIRQEFQTLPVILITANSSIDLAIDAMRRGAFDFIPKPIDQARLITTLARATDHHRLLERVTQIEGGKNADISYEGIIGISPQIRAIRQMIENVAAADCTVMVCGESGTGKELIAGAIHNRSSRSDAQLVALNMAAVPRELAESTLFGHERGAFTGADKRFVGAAEQAEKGTLFLDEICEMPLELQSKLLRFLQQRTFRRVGGSTDLTADVRIISATNRDPLEEVKQGRMREDLYYRLNVVPIHVPSLRERTGDVALIATNVLLKLSEQYGKNFREIEASAIDLLESYSWPGNVRQLVNLIERMVVLNNDEVLRSSMIPDDVIVENKQQLSNSIQNQSPDQPQISPEAVAGVSSSVNQEIGGQSGILPLSQIERIAIERAIQSCDNSPGQAAKALGISEATIYRKLKAYRSEQ